MESLISFLFANKTQCKGESSVDGNCFEITQEDSRHLEKCEDDVKEEVSIFGSNCIYTYYIYVDKMRQLSSEQKLVNFIVKRSSFYSFQNNLK